MVIDSRQKRFVMNMQLRQCCDRANAFRLKKARFCLAFLFPKKPKVFKKPEFQTLASKKPNWPDCDSSAMDVSAMKCETRFPLGCHQSAKVRTAVVWEACKRKSKSSTCPRSFQLCCIYCDSWCIPWIWKCHSRAYARRGLGLSSPLELDILQNFITCAQEINCFRILFAC